MSYKIQVNIYIKFNVNNDIYMVFKNKNFVLIFYPNTCES